MSDLNIPEILLKKQVANIVKKANSGKVLTAREEKLISEFQTAQSGKVGTKTLIVGKAALARALSVSRPTLDSWSKYPDFPKTSANGSYCLEEVVDWRNLKGFKGGESTEAEKLKLRRLLAQCKKIEAENAILMGKYEERSEVEKEIGQMVNAFKTVILELPRKAAMTCAGRSAPDIERVLIDMVQDSLMQLHRDAWK